MHECSHFPVSWSLYWNKCSHCGMLLPIDNDGSGTSATNATTKNAGSLWNASFMDWYCKTYNEHLAIGYNPVHEFKKQPIEIKYGVYQKYFRETRGWILYLRPYATKFSAYIEKFWRETVYKSDLVNNNYELCQQDLIDKAFELAALEDEQNR